VGEGEWKRGKRGGRERENEEGRNTQPVYEGNFLLSIHPSIHPSVNRQDAAANERSKGSWTTVYGVGYEMKSLAMHAS